MAWSNVEAESVLKKLKTNNTLGLSDTDSFSRFKLVGPNKFESQQKQGLLQKILKQFKSPLVIILLLAGLTTLVLGHFLDTIVIFVALTINVVIGSFQEERASKAFDKLQSSQSINATVVREGRKRVIPAEELVPGDIVLIEPGSYVPADIRVLESEELAVNESPLTGEWVSVDKKPGIVEVGVPLSDTTNMLWMGTLVVGGAGRGVVVATGNKTEIGTIAESLATTEDTPTPIQRSVRKLAVFLSYIILVIVGVIFVFGLVRGEPLGDMLLLAIAVAVSVIPGGLPAAVTAVLAIGMERILARGGLVRNLLAAETLGSTTVILTDKTGTLTEAKMSLSEVVTLVGIQGDSSEIDQNVALTASVFSSHAIIEDAGEKGLVVHGSPMERAVTQAGLEHGISQEELRKKHTRKDFLVFDSENRFSGSLNAVPGSKASRFYTLGAPEFLLKHASKVLKNGKEIKMTADARELVGSALKDRASEGMRLVAVGYKDVDWDTIPKIKNEEARDTIIEGVTFAGFIVFSDPIRSDVSQAISLVQHAGARVIMLTGDNKETAGYIARKTGISTARDRVMLGEDIEGLSDDELLRELQTAKVFARVLPKQKMRIGTVLKNSGEIVAMTGDGINDAPALQNADIGIAIGSGTEVAKEASDLVLLNNSFSIIVGAIEEGRRIIDNLKKSVTHMLSTSFHEVFIIAAAVIFGLPLPVLAVQILWVNILEEGMLSFGFAFEPAEKDIMKRDPRSERVSNVLSGGLRRLILTAGIVTGIFSLSLFLALLWTGFPIEEVRTMMFVVLTLDSIFFAISLKNLRSPFWRANFLTNAYLLVALGVSIGLLALTLTVPALRNLLSLTVLTPLELVILVGVGLFNLLTIELSKRFVFGKSSL